VTVRRGAKEKQKKKKESKRMKGRSTQVAATKESFFVVLVY